MAYFVGGAVQDIAKLPGGEGFSAEVTGSRAYRTVVVYEPGINKWVETCSCTTGSLCRHTYALMKSLLVAPVPTGEPSPEKVETPVAGQKKQPPSPFTSELESAHQRKLNDEESAYLGAISQAFLQAKKHGSLHSEDLEALDFDVPGFARDRAALWPAFPANEREFWLYLVLFLEERSIRIPGFMEPVSDPEPVRERMEQWKRERDVERWKKLLSHLHDDVPVSPPRELDLRLRFTAGQAILEARRAGEPDFTPMKPPQFKALANVPDSECTPEAALLIQRLVERAEFGLEPALRYFESDASGILNEILRVPWLASRLVAENGAPMLHPAEPLRWELSPVYDENEDYKLRLVRPDGTPAGPFLFVAKGSPTFYLTRDAIWTGPEVDARAIDPGAEARIPAPALESGHGVRFLRRLGVELPVRLRERVRTIEVKPVIRCDVQPTWAGAKEESCILEATAQSSDGTLRMVYTPDGWRRAGDEEPASDPDVYYDRSALAPLPVLLEPLALKWDEHRLHWHFKVTRKFADTFSAWLKMLPADIPVELCGELASFHKEAVAGSVRLDVEEAGVDWFDLRVVLDVSETELSKEELKLLLDARGGWVRLGNKGWRRLEFKLTEQDDEHLSRLGLSASDLSSEPQRLHALQLADKAARRFLPAEQCDQIERRAAELQARVMPDVPSIIRADLRPYQLEGFHFLAYLSANHFGGILADDMGLGKTLQTLTWLAWLRGGSGSEAALPSLVVCPKSVADNWRVETERFLPGIRVRVWHGTDLQILPRETASADLHVINYAQLRSMGEALASIPLLALILDEGQFIKNPSSATAQIARSLRSAHRLVLSGTPIENRLLDLWSLMSFAMPGALGSRAQFAKLYDAKDDPFARRRLAARVRPFVLRRTKAQVATDLPDRVEEDLYCELEGEQRTLYRAELKRAQQMLLHVTTQKQLAKERFHVLTSLMRLRQICCHPRLIKPESKAASAKLDALMEQLEPLIEEGQKVLVFSQFVEMLDILKSTIEARNWPLFYLAGKTENRGNLVREFQSAEGAAVFLISLKAGGFGLNLTAASYVVLFDPWWNPAVENQAIDRTHRIGQVNKVIAYRLLIKDSIEEKIRALQTNKRALADDVLGEEKFAQSLTLEDLQHLFSE
ncbi:MAG: DEAD/DEAH box helicase [Verrucomicrobiota bacterium]